eukprot:10305360-Ditylum_brightwellii.AAC.1
MSINVAKAGCDAVVARAMEANVVEMNARREGSDGIDAAFSSLFCSFGDMKSGIVDDDTCARRLVLAGWVLGTRAVVSGDDDDDTTNRSNKERFNIFLKVACKIVEDLRSKFDSVLQRKVQTICNEVTNFGYLVRWCLSCQTSGIIEMSCPRECCGTIWHEWVSSSWLRTCYSLSSSTVES